MAANGIHSKNQSTAMTSHHPNRILWALGAECLLLLSVLLFLDHFPAWALKTLVIMAVLLPATCYVTLATRPATYFAWLEVFKELRGGFLDAARWLATCFSPQAITRLVRYVAELETCPQNADAWFAASLFPFKLYVLAAVPFLRLSWMIASLFVYQPNWQGYHTAAELIASGYLICCTVLLFGSLLQALFSPRGRSTQTVLTFLLGAMMLWTLFPWRFAGR